jgi:pimeloyl-ACP methyl ester carboxylesterase
MTRRRKWTIALVAIGLLLSGLLVAWLINRPSLIDVGGRNVEARIRGSGTPTVVFELGGAGGTLSFWRIQNAVAKHTGTVVYERAGLGRSSLGAEPRSAETIARELHDFLVAAKLPPPYILVGHSYGGLLIRVFAYRYPAEVSGLVFVDPATEGAYAYIQKETPKEWAAAGEGVSEGLGRQTKAMSQAISEAANAWPLPNVPTVILTGQKALGQWPLKTEKDMQMWEQEHQWLASKIPGSVRVKIPDANHLMIPLSDKLEEEIVKMLRK